MSENLGYETEGGPSRTPKSIRPWCLSCLTLDLSLLGPFLPFSERGPVVGRSGVRIRASVLEGWEESEEAEEELSLAWHAVST